MGDELKNKGNKIPKEWQLKEGEIVDGNVNASTLIKQINSSLSAQKFQETLIKYKLQTLVLDEFLKRQKLWCLTSLIIWNKFLLKPERKEPVKKKRPYKRKTKSKAQLKREEKALK